MILVGQFTKPVKSRLNPRVADVAIYKLERGDDVPEVGEVIDIEGVEKSITAVSLDQADGFKQADHVILEFGPQPSKEVD